MEITITPIKEKSQAEIKVAASGNEFKPFLTHAAKHLSKESAIKGFRPGHVPLPVALETYGRERVVNEALNEAVAHLFVEAVTDRNIETIGRPAVTIEQADPEAGLKFTARVDVLPEVKLGEPNNITIARNKIVVPDEAVEKELQYLARSRSTFLEVPRPADEGDTVIVDFSLTLDGKPLEGGESKNHPVHLGEGHFVPGFEEGLKGIRAGEERTYPLKFPKDYNREELKDKEAEVKVKALAVQKRVIPEVNDELAKQLGQFSSLKHLKDELKKNMQAEEDLRGQEKLQEKLALKLADASAFGFIPEILIEREIDRRLSEFAEMLAMQNKTVEDYSRQRNKSREKIREEMREGAIKSVKINLSLREFARTNKITPTDEEVAQRLQDYLKRFSSASQARDRINEEELRITIASALKNQMALKRLEELAQITAEKK